MTVGLHQHRPGGSHPQRPDNKNAALWYDFLSAYFILSAPYLVFILDQDFVFELTNLAVLSVFAVISAALAGILRVAPLPALRILFLAVLLLFFVDIQFEWTPGWGRRVAAAGMVALVLLWVLRRHISQILAIVFGTIIVATFVPPIANSLFPDHRDRGASAAALKTGLPVYVHILLDEFPGIETFSDEIPSQKKLKSDATTFFSENSFRVFGRAYSRYYDTIDSIPSLLNFDTTGNPREFYTSTERNSRILKNRYFENILSKGYEINIYQSAFTDFCGSVDKARLNKCLTYIYYGAPSAALGELGDIERAKIILFMYANRSFFLSLAQGIYSGPRRAGASSDMSPRNSPRWNKKMGAIPSLPVFDKLIEDVSSSAGGQMFFAHLLIPHYPYSVDSECHIRRPVLAWDNRFFDSINTQTGQVNSPESRLAAYEGNIAQIRCALSKLDTLFAVMKERGTFDDSIIVIHGDHGSRIVLTEPRIKFRSFLTRQDYFDAFSTLYAVKSPAIEPGYDTRMIALPELLAGTLAGSLTDPTAPGEKERDFVFLKGGEEADFLEVPMPEFTAGEHPQ